MTTYHEQQEKGDHKAQRGKEEVVAVPLVVVLEDDDANDSSDSDNEFESHKKVHKTPIPKSIPFLVAFWGFCIAPIWRAASWRAIWRASFWSEIRRKRGGERA
jgi:hypothetical protein